MERRWRTTFGQWVQGFGVERLAQALGVTRHAVYGWVCGRTEPSLEAAGRIAALSNGQVSIDDVHKHRAEVGRT